MSTNAPAGPRWKLQKPGKEPGEYFWSQKKKLLFLSSIIIIISDPVIKLKRNKPIKSKAQSHFLFLPLSLPPPPSTESQRAAVQIYPYKTGHPFENKLGHK